MLGPMPGYTSPAYAAKPSGTSSSTMRRDAPGATMLPTSVALCVAIMNVRHNASIEEDIDNKGFTLWSQDCNADREAIILLDSNKAERLLQ